MIDLTKGMVTTQLSAEELVYYRQLPNLRSTEISQR